MEAEKTYPEIIIPSKVETTTVIYFVLRPNDFNVEVHCAGEEVTPNTFIANMVDEWNNMSQDNKDFLNSVFKKIMAEGLGITIGDITGDLWT